MLILFIIVKYGSLLIQYQKEAKQIVAQCNAQDFKSEQTSLIFDVNNTLITAMKSDKDVYYLTSQNIPYLVKLALIAVEDKTFYQHSGVDIKAILRASIDNVKSGEVTQGASTITQQLSRNIFLSHEVTVDRKLKEMFIALELEDKFSKDEILEYYINNIYFANGFYGIEAASKGYFNKSISQLTLSEITFLCSIPNNPTEYNPYIYFDNVLQRRDRILKQMFEQNNIDTILYEEALNQEIILTPSAYSKNNYVETYIRYCATIELMKAEGFIIKTTFASDAEEELYNKNYNELYGIYSARLYTGGYRIYTSINLNTQSELQNIVDSQLASNTEVNEEGIYKFQASATCIDNNTGKVIAIVGGRSQNEFLGYTLNRAYQSYRQPGSSIKPILTYTPMFERGYTPDTLVEDEKFAGGPVNSPDSYEGQITIRNAVVKSKNTVAWKLFERLTPSTGISYLKEMYFRKIDVKDYVPAMSIGGMTYGVSTLEMASAYSTLENDGLFRYPTCIVKITDASGNTIVNVEGGEKQVYKKNATRMMSNILKDVLVNGTGKKYQISNAICAAKTGTTNGNKDIWMVGYSNYYTTAVWVGYDIPQVINDSNVVSSSGLIWKNFMSAIHNELEIKDFEPYE